MVRLFSELLNEKSGIRIHLTGLNPIRPGNAPDDWERGALSRFNHGQKEFYDLANLKEGELFRYMAPLEAKPSCLRCHESKGYKDGDVLGGFGVYFSFDPFRRIEWRNNRQLYISHFVLLISSLLLIAVIGRSLTSNIRALQKSQAQLKTLEGILPICAKCKKVRKEGLDPMDPAAWTVLEEYLGSHTEATFTHGLCPGCAEEVLSELPKSVD